LARLVVYHYFGKATMKQTMPVQKENSRHSSRQTVEANLATEDMPSRYHCSPEWHLSRLRHTPFAGLLYSFARRISKESGRFHGSVVGMAEYFGVSRFTAQRAIAALVDLGFFVQVAREPFSPVVYRPVSHNDWAAKHPGNCAVKEWFPWSSEGGDELGVRLWNASGGKVKFMSFQLVALRNTGLSDEQIVAAFEEFVAAGQARRQAGGRNGHQGSVQSRFLRWLKGRAQQREPSRSG
jgi:hypothetical protein